jgi:hypothetical protein
LIVAELDIAVRPLANGRSAAIGRI